MSRDLRGAGEGTGTQGQGPSEPARGPSAGRGRPGLSPLESAFYGPQAEAVAPESEAELVETIREAEVAGRPVVPAGLGSQAHLGNPPPPGALVVSLRRLDGIVRYEPDDFTIGVRAGTPLAILRGILRERRQEIPADFPRAAAGTVGGAVSAAQPGPRTGSLGPLKSFVIGARAVRGGGSTFRTGGMVVKNVAGYDLGRLLIGALGTAGCLLEVNFKLRALPASRSAGVAAFASAVEAWELIRALRAARLEPAALWAVSGTGTADIPPLLPEGPPSPHLAVWLFEGNEATVRCLEDRADEILRRTRPEAVRRRTGDEAEELLEILGRMGSPNGEAHEDLGIVRLRGLPATARRVAEGAMASLRVGDGLKGYVASDGLTGLVTVRWRTQDSHGGSRAVASVLHHLREIARRDAAGGHIIYLHASSRGSLEYLLTPDPERDLARRVLAVLDPRGIFCPGRIHGLASSPARAPRSPEAAAAPHEGREGS